jgi:DNA-binding cell septation regulator SpoVG
VYHEVSEAILEARLGTGQRRKEMPEISDIRVWPTRGDGKIKANADFVYDGQIRIKCSVREGPKGNFVGFPGRYGDKVDPKTNKKKWYSDVYFIDNDLKSTIETQVMSEYQKALNSDGMHQGEGAGPTNQESGQVPF